METDCENPKPLGIGKLKKAIKEASERALIRCSRSEVSREAVEDQKMNFRGCAEATEEATSSASTSNRGLRARHREFERTAQENLAGFLNDLGIALNYAKRTTHASATSTVLNPQWVTEGIYSRFSMHRCSRRLATLHVKQVGTILSAAPTRKEMHTFVFELMRSLSFAFPSRIEICKYLISILLSKRRASPTHGHLKRRGSNEVTTSMKSSPKG